MDDQEKLRLLQQRDAKLARIREEQAVNEPATGVSDLLARLGMDVPNLAMLSPAEREQLQAERRRADEERLKRDTEEHRRQVITRVLQCVPPKYRETVLAENYRQTRAVEIALAWENDRAYRGLILRGGTGVGKSMASAAALAQAVRRWQLSISWHRPNDFVSAMLHGYDPESPKMGTQLLVIDDVGRETKADFEESFCAFLDDMQTRFIISTNLTRDAFEERYRGRVFDRLKECAVGFSLKGESMRRGGEGL